MIFSLSHVRRLSVVVELSVLLTSDAGTLKMMGLSTLMTGTDAVPVKLMLVPAETFVVVRGEPFIKT